MICFAWWGYRISHLSISRIAAHVTRYSSHFVLTFIKALLDLSIYIPDGNPCIFVFHFWCIGHWKLCNKFRTLSWAWCPVGLNRHSDSKVTSWHWATLLLYFHRFCRFYIMLYQSYRICTLIGVGILFWNFENSAFNYYMCVSKGILNFIMILSANNIHQFLKHQRTSFKIFVLYIHFLHYFIS